ncbi:MAG: hybrid sensor histidine kinase/response regulator [Pedosphaera sp.]|nr:hybrid sensor histidine kinase/response regulator [Pedosphaera sp.]
MENFYDYKRFAVLYVDDEEMSLKYFSRAFSESFRILTASTAEEGYAILEKHGDEIGVIMSDQRMPGMKGVQFLEKTRQLQPRIIRILATAFSDLDAAIDSVNTGAIYKYITKPWDVPALEMTLKRGLEFFLVQRERDTLMREKLSALHGLVVTDRVLSLGVLASGLSHLVRNGMAAVNAFLELAPDRLTRDNIDLVQLRNPQLWREFHRQVQNRVKLSIDLLDDPSRSEPRPTFRFDSKLSVTNVIQEAIESCKEDLRARAITAQIDPGGEAVTLTADGVKFHRLFKHLLRVELMHLPDGSQIRFAVNSVGTEIKVQLTDNGSGLPQDAILSLFDPLHPNQGKKQELGIYLLACYFIVYHHGGRLAVPTGEKSGCFQISFPLTPIISSADSDSETFIVSAMSNERLWEKLLPQG